MGEYELARKILDQICCLEFQVVEAENSEDFTDDSPFTVADAGREQKLLDYMEKLLEEEIKEIDTRVRNISYDSQFWRERYALEKERARRQHLLLDIRRKCRKMNAACMQDRPQTYIVNMEETTSMSSIGKRI